MTHERNALVWFAGRPVLKRIGHWLIGGVVAVAVLAFAMLIAALACVGGLLLGDYVVR